MDKMTVGLIIIAVLFVIVCAAGFYDGWHYGPDRRRLAMKAFRLFMQLSDEDQEKELAILRELVKARKEVKP